MTELITKLKKDIKEKEVQDILSQFFKFHYKNEIYEELQKTDRDEELQAHPYLLIQDLKKAIENGNKSLYRIYSHISREVLTNKLLKEFIKSFDSIINDPTKSNKDLYELYTLNDKKQIILTDKNNNECIENYFILNLTNPEQNILQIIKEKRIKELNRKTEYPDFAIYLNGLPAVCIEIKPLNVGYEESKKDILNKKTYHRFLYCIGTDTENTFITSNYESNSVFLWNNYGDNPSTGNSFFDLASEILLKPEDLIYYIVNNTFISENKLVNARVQQYFAAKKVINALKGKDPVEVYFKHQTRSGKSITFKYILEYVKKFLNYKYKKIFILTHDLTVKDNLNNVLIQKNNQSYRLIKSKEDFEKAINEKVSDCKVYLTNIQKMESSLENIKKEIKNSEQYLFLVDENHTHQNLESGYAAVRKVMFPKASYVSATATPIYEQKKDIIIDITEQRMGKQVDNFTPNDARKAKIVLPCFFKYAKWKSVLEDNKDLLAKFENLETQINYYLNQQKKDISFFIEQFIQNKRIQTILNSKSLDCSKEDELEKILEIYLDSEIIDNEIFDYYTNSELEFIISSFKEYQNNSLKKINSEETKLVIESLKRELTPKKIDLIVRHIKELEEKSSFIPKAFLVVSSIEEGLKLMLDIKKQILLDSPDDLESLKQTKYKNIRFGLDVSNPKIDQDKFSSIDKILIQQVDFDESKVNGTLINGKMSVKEEFMLQEKEAIQVLIIVGKHLMGFDLKELVTVFLNKYIHDIKLIMQIATRGATVRDGKECSYVYDLTPNKEINLSIYKKAFDIYNLAENSNNSSIAISEDDALNILKQIEKTLIPSFLNIFKFNDENEIRTKKGKLKALTSINSLKDKDLYFNLVKELNTQLENIIIPSIFINFAEKLKLKTFLINLKNINKELIERNELFKLSETQKRDILHKNLELLKIDITDVATSIFGEDLPEEVTLNEYSAKEIEILESRNKDLLKNKLMDLKKSVADKSIVKELEELLSLLENNLNTNEIDIIKKRTNEIKLSITQKIINEHNNNPLSLYLTNMLENLMEENKEYVHIITKELLTTIDEAKSNKSNKEDMIETIKESLIYSNSGNGLKIKLWNLGVKNIQNNKIYEKLKEEILIFIDEILEYEHEIFYFLDNK